MRSFASLTPLFSSIALLLIATACDETGREQAEVHASSTQEQTSEARTNEGARLTPTQATGAPTEVRAQPGVPPETGRGQASFITAKSLDELADEASIIVIGQLSKTDETVNMARNVSDITKPDPSIFILGQVYEIDVQRYVKGSSDETLQLLQPQAFLNQDRATLTEENLNQAKASYPYVEIRSGARYLLFLEPTKGFPGRNYYTGVSHPWRFSLPREGMAEPESAWHGARSAFPAAPSDALVRKVEDIVNGDAP